MKLWTASGVVSLMFLTAEGAWAQADNDVPFDLPPPVKIEKMPDIEVVPPRPECEIVIIQELEDGGQLIGYASAEDFLESVYDEEKTQIEDVEGHLIRAVLCTREDIIPTLRDFPVLATGIPLSLSQDFDASDSRVTSLYFKDGAFRYKYIGEDLSKEDQMRLDDIVEIYNFQPHDLVEPETAKNKDTTKESESHEPDD